MIVIRMADGIIFNAHEVSLDTFALCFRKALKKKQVLEIDGPHGQRRMVNPQQVLYFEEAM